MVDKVDVKPVAVLAPGFLPAYERDITALHLQLSSLRTNLFVLEHLVAFPFGILAPGQATFWTVVVRNLYFSSLATAWGLAFDTDDRSLTVVRFRNAVLPKITDARVAKAVKERLAAIDFDAVRDRLRPRLDLLRHKVIAHLDRELLSQVHGVPAKVPGVALSELKDLCQVLDGVINALGFGTHYSTLPIDYDATVTHPPGVDPRPDVERILDDLARHSEYLNMPERQPQEWPFLCIALSDDDLAAINRYRSKFGLAPCTRPAT
jgi:hypothetical protein